MAESFEIRLSEPAGVNTKKYLRADLAFLIFFISIIMIVPFAVLFLGLQPIFLILLFPLTLAYLAALFVLSFMFSTAAFKDGISRGALWIGRTPTLGYSLKECPEYKYSFSYISFPNFRPFGNGPFKHYRPLFMPIETLRGFFPAKKEEVASRLLLDKNGEYLLLDCMFNWFWRPKVKFYLSHKEFLKAYSELE